MDLVTEINLAHARRDLAALESYHAERTAVPHRDRLELRVDGPNDGSDGRPIGTLTAEWSGLSLAEVTDVLLWLESHTTQDQRDANLVLWGADRWRPGWQIRAYAVPAEAAALGLSAVATPAASPEDLVERLRRDA